MEQSKIAQQQELNALLSLDKRKAARNWYRLWAAS